VVVHKHITTLNQALSNQIYVTAMKTHIIQTEEIVSEFKLADHVTPVKLVFEQKYVPVSKSYICSFI